MPYKLYRTHDFTAWYEDETKKSQIQIDDRLSRLENDEHFGHKKDLDDGIFELKFNDGRRIYYTIIPKKKVILIIGGNKNGQDKDIKKARNYLRKISEC